MSVALDLFAPRTRVCTKCSAAKRLTEFYFYKATGKPHAACKKCSNQLNKAWRDANPEIQRASKKAWRRKHPERYRVLKKQWRLANKDKVRRTNLNLHKRCPEKKMFKSAQKRAARYGIPFDLAPSDIVVPEFCPVLGIRLAVLGGQPTDASPSLDRVVPDRGYVRGNVAVISFRANAIKTNATLDELERVTAWVRMQGAGTP